MAGNEVVGVVGALASAASSGAVVWARKGAIPGRAAGGEIRPPSAAAGVPKLATQSVTPARTWMTEVFFIQAVGTVRLSGPRRVLRPARGVRPPSLPRSMLVLSALLTVDWVLHGPRDKTPVVL